MSMDQRAAVLNIVISAPCGVREVIQKVELRNSSVVYLLKKMAEEKLVDLRRACTHKRGRPMKIVTCTPLGFDFLETYRRLQMKPLRARDEDLDRAVEDASYTKRLVEAGHSAYELFMELNTIANNIKGSSEAPEAV